MGRVVILGCGPSGLAAAHAAASSGYETIIISSTDKPSKLYGCQYLHAPVPGYEDASRVRVSYRLAGTAEQYRRKVYGAAWPGKVSPEDFAGDHDAWDIRETYERMWIDLIDELVVGLIVRRVVRGSIPFISSLCPDLTISTIPAQALCSKPAHEFHSHTIWANGSTAAEEAAENEIICDDTVGHAWYRMSNVFGYRTTEWSRLPNVKATNAAPVIKPLWTSCTCHPEIMRAGRYGAWEKRRLVHEVFPSVMEALR